MARVTLKVFFLTIMIFSTLSIVHCENSDENTVNNDNYKNKLTIGKYCFNTFIIIIIIVIF